MRLELQEKNSVFDILYNLNNIQNFSHIIRILFNIFVFSSGLWQIFKDAAVIDP